MVFPTPFSFDLIFYPFLFFSDVMYAFLTDGLSTGTIQQLERNNKWPRRG